MPNEAPTDSSAAADATAFAGMLQTEHDALGAFVRVLQAEQEVLIKGDADRLAELASDKAAQIELLSGLGLRRKRHLAAQNLPDNADGMRSWLRCNLACATPAPKIWLDLLAYAETAQQINASNGLLIEERLRQNRLKLAVLQTAQASESVYQPDGRFYPPNTGRILGQV